jgi:hypothetical protein
MYDKKISDTERENDGDNPDTLGDKAIVGPPLSPIISFSDTDLAKMRRKEEADEEEEKKRRKWKDVPSRSTLSVPGVRLKDDVEDSGDSSEGSREDDKGDAEKHNYLKLKFC